MSATGLVAPKTPTCKLCKKTMVRDHLKTVIRSNGTEMRVYGCECGARTTLLCKPAIKRKRLASFSQKKPGRIGRSKRKPRYR